MRRRAKSYYKRSVFCLFKSKRQFSKRLLETFLKRSAELQLNLSDCRGQCYDNGANMKEKKAGLQARILRINPKALFVPCANHSLSLIVINGPKSYTEALLFFGVLTQLYSLFSSSTQRRTILKNMPGCHPSATRWENRINCIMPLRYHYSDVVGALKELINYCLEKKDGKIATEARSLIVHIIS